MEDNLVLAGFVVMAAGTMLGLYLFFGRYKQHKRTSGRWWRLPLGNLLVLLFVGAGAVLLAELYYRFWYDETDGIGVAKTAQRWMERHWQQNRWNFRDDREYVNVRPPGKRRITFIGDSFTAGHGIRDINDRFANRIRQTHPDWDVHVLASCGWNSGDELDELANLVFMPYEFDQVVLVYVLNDIEDADQDVADQKAEYREQRLLSITGYLAQHSYWFNTLSLHYSYLFPSPRAANNEGSERKHTGGWQDAYFTSTWEAHVPRLKAMRDIVRDRGGHFAVVTFPDMMGRDYSYRKVHERLGKYWQSLGVDHLDLLPVYERYEREELIVNKYDSHPNEFSHGLAADAISRFLERQPWLERGRVPTGPPPGETLNAAVVSETIACLQKFALVNPDKARTFYTLGLLLAGRSDLEPAIANYRRAVELRPNFEQAHQYLGDALAARENFDEAIAEWHKVLEINPDNARAANNLGKAFLLRGSLDEAIDLFRKTLAIDRSYPGAPMQLSSALAEREKTVTRLTQWNNEMRMFPDDIDLPNNISWTLATSPISSIRNGKEAIKLAQRAVELSKSRKPTVLGTLAAAYAEAGDFPKAVETARSAIDLAKQQNQKALAESLQVKLRLYEAGKPFRDFPSPSGRRRP